MKRIKTIALVATVVVAVIAVMVSSKEATPSSYELRSQEAAESFFHCQAKYHNSVGTMADYLKYMEENGYYNNRAFTNKVLTKLHPTTSDKVSVKYNIRGQIKGVVADGNTAIVTVVWDYVEEMPSGLLAVKSTRAPQRTMVIMAGTPTPMPLHATTK